MRRLQREELDPDWPVKARQPSSAVRVRRTWKARVRVRSILRTQLPWLFGYPLAFATDAAGRRVVRWEYMANGESVRLVRCDLTAEQLRQANYGLTRLLCRYPRALAKVVGDVATWRERVRRLMEMLQAWIHEGVAPGLAVPLVFDYRSSERDRIQTIVRSHPEIRELAARLTWALQANPRQRRKALDFVQHLTSQRSFVKDAGILVRVWLLADRLRVRDWPLLERFTNPQLLQVPSKNGEQVLRAFLRQLAMVAKGKATDVHAPTFLAIDLSHAQRPRDVVAMLDWLLARPKEQFRSAAAWLGVLLDPGYYAAWTDWWQALAGKVADIRSELAKVSKYERRAIARAAYSELEKLREGLPFPLSLRRIRNFVGGLAPKSKSPSLRAATAVIAALYGEEYSPLRLELLKILMALPEAQLRTLPREIIRVLPTKESHRLEWLRLLRRPNVFDPLSYEWLGDRSVVLTVLASLVRLCQHADIDWSHKYHYLLRDLAELTKDPEKTADYFVAAHRQGISHFFYVEDLAQTVFEIARDATEFVAIARSVCALDTDKRWSLAHPARILANAGWTDLVRLLLLHRPGELAGFLPQLQFLESQRLAIELPRFPSVEQPDTVLGRYPAAIGRVIRRYQETVRELDRVVENAIGATFPEWDKLLREITYLERRVQERSDPPLVQRLEKLRGRIADVREIPQDRAQRLARKLEQRLQYAVLAEWREQLETRARSAIATLLRNETVPEKIARPEWVSVFYGLMRCPPKLKSLGLEIIRRWLAGDQPLKTTHPANLAFVSRMEKVGIQMSAWLTAEPLASINIPGKGEIIFRLDDDPLRVFRMGAMFSTCLSPDDCNFFSTVSIAADANKRVLFAFDQQENVVGRALFAMTRDGRLVRFHVYAHHAAKQLELKADDILHDLARRMRTAVADKGDIECLVVDRWYDDGTEMCARLPGFAEKDSAFRRAVATMTAEDFVQQLTAICAENRLVDGIISLVSTFPEVRARVDLVRSMLQFAREKIELKPALGCQLAEACVASGAIEAASELVKKYGVRHLANVFRRDAEPAAELSTFLVECHPSIVLRAWRLGKATHVHSEMEESRARRQLLAGAHAALGRRRFAAELLGKK